MSRMWFFALVDVWTRLVRSPSAKHILSRSCDESSSASESGGDREDTILDRCRWEMATTLRMVGSA